MYSRLMYKIGNWKERIKASQPKKVQKGLNIKCVAKICFTVNDYMTIIRVSQNVQTGKLMLATSFSDQVCIPKRCGKTKKNKICLISSIDSSPSKF